MNDIVLILFFLIFTAISLRNIRYGVYTVVFSMPLYLIRFSISGIPMTALEVMIYILFLVWIFSRIRKNDFYLALVEGFGGFNRLYKKNFILSIGITLLFLGVIISTTLSSDLRTSLGILKGWFINPFLFFIVFISVIKNNKQIVLSLKSWTFSGVAVSLISIFYLLNNELTFDGRLKSFFLSPNHLAMYLSPALLIAVWFLLKETKFPIGNLVSSWKTDFSSKKMKVVVLIIILIPLYFTYSYGAFLGIFAGVACIFYKTYKFKINKSYFLKQYLSFPRRRESTITIDNKLYNEHINKKSFFKIVVLVIFVSFIFISVGKFDQITNSDNRSSFHSRLMIWNTSKEIIKDNHFLGIGPGTFQEAYLSYAEKFDKPYLEWAVPQPHNIFLAFYLQTGLIGFIGFILILIWFFMRNLKYKNNIQYPISNILISLMVYTLVHGLVDTTYWKNDLALIFWLIIGMAVVKNNKMNIGKISQNPALDKN